MWILMAHNYYSSRNPSGENIVFDREVQQLRDNGFDVHVFTYHSDNLHSAGPVGKILAGAAIPWNPFAAASFSKALRETRPHIVHVHNTFPLLSPSILRTAHRRAAVVMTLHNYRLFCAASTPARNGAICVECLDKRSALPSLRHGCYRSSRLATLPIAAGISINRALATWNRYVHGHITLSAIQRNTLIDAGLPADTTHIKPNFHPGQASFQCWEDRDDHIVFVGRLARDKGLQTLLDAWRMWGAFAPKLRIIGNGPLKEHLLSFIQADDYGKIDYLSALPHQLVQREIERAKLLVLPSEWFEGCPLVIGEAFAAGTPVAVSNIGALPEFVQHDVNGVIFKAFSSDHLYQEVSSLWADPSRLLRLAECANLEFRQNLSAKEDLQILLDIYQHAIADSWKNRHDDSANEHQSKGSQRLEPTCPSDRIAAQTNYPGF